MNPLLEIGLTHFLLVTIVLFAAGVATILTKRNAIGILIGVELILNAAGINMVAFNHYRWSGGADGSVAIEGVMFTAFIIVLAAAEAAIALAIVLNYYNTFNTVDVEQADALRG